MEKQPEDKNRDVLEELLAAFAKAEERLTPEMEPATVYLPNDDR